MGHIESWWSKTYQLPITDERFQGLTRGELLEDFLTAMAERLDDLRTELRHERDRNRQAHLQKAIGALEELLFDRTGPEDLIGKTGDAFIDRMMLEVLEGKSPDLNQGIPERILKYYAPENRAQRDREARAAQQARSGVLKRS